MHKLGIEAHYTTLLCFCFALQANRKISDIIRRIKCVIIFFFESATYSCLYASVINLITLTIERYLKVVHPFWSKKNIKRWMTQVAMAFAWIAAILYILPVFPTTVVKDGNCLPYFVWESPATENIYIIFGIFVFFLLPLIVFIYCYGHIVVVMRRQMRVMAGHAGGGSQMNASQIQSKRVKWNIIKTMIIVSVAFVICWLPINIYFMIIRNTTQLSNIYIGYFPMVFLAYLNICMNPFIYATKREGVKQILACLVTCCKCKGTTAVGNDSGNRSNNAGQTTASADAARP